MRSSPRPLPRPFSMPWGRGRITEEATVARDHWEPAIQLMEYEDGQRGLRLCFYSRGRFNRNPMMISEDDLDNLRRELDHAPQSRELLRRLAG